MNGKSVNVSMDDYSTFRSQNPMKHNYAHVLDLHLDAKIKTMENKKLSIDPYGNSQNSMN